MCASAAAAGGGGGVVTCDHSGLHIFLIFEPIFGTVTLLKKSSDDDGRGQRLGLGASLSARRAAAAAAASSRELSVPLQTGVQK